MREIVIQPWCDVCPAHTVRADESIVLDLGSGPRRIDVCETCFNNLIKPLVPAVEEHGVAPEAGERSQPKRTSAHAHGGADPGHCPLCDRDVAWLSTHVRSNHPEVKPETYLRHTKSRGYFCPWCTETRETTQQLSHHVGRAHPGSRIMHWAAERATAAGNG